MNVIREDVDALNANLKVQIEPIDYQEKVKKTLEKYRKTAKIPGFRPGHVPFGMIQKQYGKGALLEELNSVVNKGLHDFIETNKIEILGNPIPVEEKGLTGDFEKPENFEFVYKIGLVPTIDVEISEKSKFDYVKVKVDKDLIDKQISDLSKRYGKLSSAEEIGENDLIMGQFVELNDDKSIKEAGILNSSTFSMDFIKDEATKKKFVGSKIGDKIIVDIQKLSRNEQETAELLGIKEEEIANHNNNFQVTVNEIKAMQPAELNQELYDKLFGPNTVQNEADLRTRIESDLKDMFSKDSDRILSNNIYKNLIEQTEVILPDTFLKEWIKLSNENKISDEQIEEEYDNYAKGLKWSLIQGNIFKKNNLTVNQEEVMDFTKQLLANNYAQYGMDAPDDAELTTTARGFLQKREEAERIQEMLIEQKLNNFFKTTVKLNEKEVSYDEFVEIAAQK